MKVLIILILIVIFSGHAALADDLQVMRQRWDTERRDIGIKYAKLIYYPLASSRCKDRDKSTDSLDSYQNCIPLVSEELQPKFDNISERYKKQSDKTAKRKIFKEYSRLVEVENARIRLRYKNANWEEVDLKCKAEEKPVCDNLHVFELFALLSNDQIVLAQLQTELDKLTESHRVEISALPPSQVAEEKGPGQQVARGIGKILQGMGQATIHAHDNEINCTSYNYGYGGVRTTCN